MHEHSGNGGFVACADLDAWDRVRGVPANAETDRLDEDLSHDPRDEPKPAECSHRYRNEIVGVHPPLALAHRSSINKAAKRNINAWRLCPCGPGRLGKLSGEPTVERRSDGAMKLVC